MTHTYNDIVSRVRILLDYNENASSIDGADAFATTAVDTLTVDDAIIANITTGFRNVVENAPVDKLLSIAVKVAITQDKAYGNYFYVDLPKDFIRLIACKSSKWHYPVTELTDQTSEKFLAQFGNTSGLIADETHPIASIIPHHEASVTDTCNLRLLMFYYGAATSIVPSTSGTSSIPSNMYDPCSYYIYVPAMSADDIEDGLDTTVAIDERLWDALCYSVAAFTAETFKDTEKCNQLIGIAKMLMGE